MARKKKARAFNPENLPVFVPETSSLPFWCLLIFHAFLCALTQISLMRNELESSKKKITSFEALLKRSADFLNTTSNNSNWPSSVTASPIMERGRSLLDEIRTSLGIAGRKQTTKKADNEATQDNTDNTVVEASATEVNEDKASTTEKAAKPRAPRHPGVNRKQQKPDEIRNVVGQVCPYCHGHNVNRGSTFSIFQTIDILIRKFVTHFHVWDCVCEDCGRHFKPDVPPEGLAGNGHRLTALIGLLTALGISRRKIQDFLRQVADIDISQGGIQKCLDRVSDATTPHYGALKREARRMPVNHVDETSSRLFGPAGKAKHWLWAMVSSTIIFFMIQSTRSLEAFRTLTGDWNGVLISDGYALYLQWAGEDRQTCLAHMIRRARRLSESTDPEIARGGRWVLAELRRLVRMAHTPPTNGQFLAWKGRFSRCVHKYLNAENEMGTFAKQLQREAENLTTFLGYKGVDATNNRCERAIRPYVCRRKTSFGATSLHGEDDISKLLSLHETCRLNGRSTYRELLTAIEHQARRTMPNLYWIRRLGVLAKRNFA